jgi:hypothetical protein
MIELKTEILNSMQSVLGDLLSIEQYDRDNYLAGHVKYLEREYALLKALWMVLQ